MFRIILATNCSSYRAEARSLQIMSENNKVTKETEKVLIPFVAREAHVPKYRKQFKVIIHFY